MTPHKNNHGLTLVELLIAIVLASIISIALVTTFASFSRTQTVQENVVDMQQNLRAGLYLMGREFRMAGYKGPNPSSVSGAEITAATINSLTFTALADDDGIDNNSDGVIDETGELTTIQYAHDATTRILGRSVDGAGLTTVAESIQALEFNYKSESGATIPDTTSLADRASIRAVEITMLAQARRSDPDFNNTTTYTTLSGAAWGPYNDGLRRRLGEGFIFFRNL